MARAKSGRAGEGGAKKSTRRREPTLADEIADSGETPESAAAVAEREVKDDLVFLAREFLTWLVHRAETEGGAFEGDGDVPAFSISFGGRFTLRSPAGLVTDIVMKGPSPVGSADLRYALAGGLAIKEAELRLEQGDREYAFGLAAEHFDVKRCKLPALLDEEGDDPGEERTQLLAMLDAALQLAFFEFLEVRRRPAWHKSVVPAIRAWLEEGT